MRVLFYTLGCKVNQNETASLTRLFCENGFTVASKGEVADVYIVNSCTVTSGGDKKSKQLLRRAKRENPNAITVLTGCFPQAFEQKAKEITQADIVTGSNEREKLLQHVRQYISTKNRIVSIEPYKRKQDFEELPLPQAVGRTRAFVKIQDGCNRRCAYCIIPFARGSARSRSEESILIEVENICKDHCAEIVLTGINLSLYGQDAKTNLGELVEKVAKIKGVKNIRLGSLEPDILTDDILNKIAGVDKVCAQFHLALQSGCNKTLKEMNRLYTTEEYEKVMLKMRGLVPNATFITDVIVGFPGETQEDFEISMQFVKRMRFLKVHVFSFSPREGTKAFDMNNKINADIIASRSAVMQKATDEVRCELIGEMKGNKAKVILESNMGNDVFTGYTREYVPVKVAAKGHESGDVVDVVLGDYDSFRCEATLI